MSDSVHIRQRNTRTIAITLRGDGLSVHMDLVIYEVQRIRFALEGAAAMSSNPMSFALTRGEATVLRDAIDLMLRET